MASAFRSVSPSRTPTAVSSAAASVTRVRYCHHPAFDEEFFRQLTAEELVTRIVKGYRKQEWVKRRERNEALDTAVGNRAAASMFGIDRFGEKQWAELEAQIADRVRPPAAAVPAPDPPAIPPPPQPVVVMEQKTERSGGDGAAQRTGWPREPPRMPKSVRICFTCELAAAIWSAIIR